MKDFDNGGPSSITIRIEYLNTYSLFNSDIVSFVYETGKREAKHYFLNFCILVLHIAYFVYHLG